MDGMLEPLRNYCERTGDLPWSEPLNAISNIAFFIAAWMLWKQYRHNNLHDRPTLALIVLLATIGFGSTLFHVFANGLTMWADVIPIGVFTFYYLWQALRRLLGFNRIWAVASLIVFVKGALRLASTPNLPRYNGSIDYFPCLAALLLIAFVLMLRKHPAGIRIALAAGLFVISLTFRSIDFMVCPTFPPGTHFLWHIINGAMLYLLTSVFTRRASAAK